MDMIGGFTGHAILGWGIKSIEQAIQAQLKKYPILITKLMVMRIGKIIKNLNTKYINKFK